jgi:hypothetical protein
VCPATGLSTVGESKCFRHSGLPEHPWPQVINIESCNLWQNPADFLFIFSTIALALFRKV